MFDDNIAWVAGFFYANGFCLYLELVESSRHSIKYVEEREYFAKKHHAVLVADDYGTESSNIELLYDFNFNCVKIPRKFIVGIDKDQKQVICKCHAPTLRTVWSGVHSRRGRKRSREASVA